MTDPFEAFLAAELAPPERLPDRQFVARVQAGIALEQQLIVHRRWLVAELFKELVALGAVAAGLWWVARAPVTGSLAQSPAVALAVLLVAFALLIAAFGAAAGRANDFSGLARYRS